MEAEVNERESDSNSLLASADYCLKLISRNDISFIFEKQPETPSEWPLVCRIKAL